MLYANSMFQYDTLINQKLRIKEIQVQICLNHPENKVTHKEQEVITISNWLLFIHECPDKVNAINV